MKTQLMHDILESGSVALPAAQRFARRQPPAGPPRPTPEQASALPPIPPIPPARPAPPPPAADPAAPSAAPASPDAAMPDWLVERLREDADQAERAHLRSRRKRRAAHGGIAAAVLLALATAGWQLVQENRVDGALHAVASTAPEESAAVPVAPMVPVVPGVPNEPMGSIAPRAAQPSGPPLSVPSPSSPPPSAAPAPAPVVADPPAVPAAAPSTPTVPQDPPPNHAVVHARSTAHSATTRPSAGRPPSTRRREETLMQCRAHGYDAVQCAQRACTMTRFGFACRG